MFHFHEPLGFLNAANDSYDPFGTRSKQYYSLSEQVSGILYGLTYWGDYGGDSISRYHYDFLLENCGHIVTSVEGAYGQGLVLTHVFYPVDENGTHALSEYARKIYRSEIDTLKAFMSWAIDAPSDSGMTRRDYPIFDETAYSNWEFEKIQSIIREDIDGWRGSDIRSQFDRLVNWEGDISGSDIDTDEIMSAIDYLQENANEYPYFEDAVSVYTPGAGNDEIAQRILDVRTGNAQLHQEDSLF